MKRNLLIALLFILLAVLIGVIWYLAGCAQTVETSTTTTTTTTTTSSTATTTTTTSTTTTTYGLTGHFTKEGAADGDVYGYDVDGAGDVNNDGYDDVIAGAIQAGAGTTVNGYVYVYSGLDGSQLHYKAGKTSGDKYGNSVAGVGDINSDGYDDFIVGASRAVSNKGEIKVYSGQTGNLLERAEGTYTGDRFGVSVSGAGDVNNDGTPDFIVGETGWDRDKDGKSEEIDVGRAYVYSGATLGGAGIGAQALQSLSVIHTFTGEAAGDILGNPVRGAGDVNNDGYADLIVSARKTDVGGLSNVGRVYVYSGIDGSTLYVKSGDSANDEFGIGSAGVGDVNNDGYADFAVSASPEARVYVYSGRTGSELYTVTQGTAADFFGYPINGLGDVNNDGYDDFAVGALYTISNTGAAYIYSGVDGSLLWSQAGAAAGDGFGMICGAGDVDNDGTPDVVIGELGWPIGSYKGRIQVFLSR